MYGFAGRFRVVRAEWVIFEQVVSATHQLTLGQRFRRWRWKRAGRLTHFLWEFEAIKG
jgi:hypothetical protein